VTIPFVPLITDSVAEPQQFEYLKTFPWVLPPLRYTRADDLQPYWAKRQLVQHGIGLAISKQIAELMHGSITVSSVVGEGSMFRLRLDVSQAPAPPPLAISRGGARREWAELPKLPTHLCQSRWCPAAILLR
jgi:hypothetical protein